MVGGVAADAQGVLTMLCGALSVAIAQSPVPIGVDLLLLCELLLVFSFLQHIEVVLVFSFLLLASVLPLLFFLLHNE